MEEFRKNLTLSIIVIASGHLEWFRVWDYVLVTLHIACLLLLSPHKPLMLDYPRVRNNAVLPKTFKKGFDQLVTKRDLWVHHELRERRLHYHLNPDFERVWIFYRVGLLHLFDDIFKFLARLIWIWFHLLDSLLQLIKPLLNQDFAFRVHHTWSQR